MDENHLSEEEVWAVGRGEKAAVSRWFRHAVHAECDECLARCQPLIEAALLEKMPDESVALPVDERYDEPLARAEAAVLARLPRIERAQKRATEVRAVLAALSELRHLDPLPSLSDSQQRRLLGWPAIEAQLAASFKLRYSNPEAMLVLAEWAKDSARNLSPKQYSPALVADFQARTWIELANAYRVTDDFPSAEHALSHADELFPQGTGDILVLARLLDVKASLRADQRRFAEAFDRLDVLEKLYQDIGERHLAGRALVSRGIFTVWAGDPQRALHFFTQAEPLLDRVIEPELFLSCRVNRLRGLVDCRRFREARQLALSFDFKAAFTHEPLNLARVRWIEGLMFVGLSDDLLAEEAFEDAGPIFLENGLHFEAALVSLDLVALWLRQGKAQAVAELAEDLVATFESLHIHREALVALRYVQEACRFQCLTAETVDQVKRFLERLERDPGQRFQLP